MSQRQNEAVYRRDCPECGREIMAAATKCGYCWAKLEPLAPGSVGTRLGAPPVTTPYPPIDEALRMDCPRCGRRIMAAATRCGYCWIRLAPLNAGRVAVVTGPPRAREVPDAAL